MDIGAYIAKWRGKEIVAYCGRMKYRGTLDDIVEADFMVIKNAVVMNTESMESTEYAHCVLNVTQLSSVGFQEFND